MERALVHQHFERLVRQRRCCLRRNGDLNGLALRTTTTSLLAARTAGVQLQSVCHGGRRIVLPLWLHLPGGCTNPDALEDDGSCLYPFDLDACDCDGSVEDVLGICGGTCFRTRTKTAFVTTWTTALAFSMRVCNAMGRSSNAVATTFPKALRLLWNTCGDLTQILEIPNPFLELPYVQAPFISSYTGV